MVDQALLDRFRSNPSETWPALVTRVSSIANRADRSAVRRLVVTGSLLPSGQILRGGGIRGTALASCMVAESSSTDEVTAVDAIGLATRMGVGVGINISRLVPTKLLEDRKSWLVHVVTSLAQEQERNSAEE